MIIKCEQCSTKFRLDDAKVKDKGVKVRCAKCRHVFTVTKQQGLESQPDTLAGPAPAAVSGPDEASVKRDTALGAEAGALSGFSFAAPSAGVEPSFAPPAEEPTPAPAEDGDFDFSFSDDVREAAAHHEETAAPANEFDFSGFDFGDAAAEKGGGTTPDAGFGEGGPDSAASVSTPDAADFDFGAEGLFGDAVTPPASDEHAEPITFDFPVDAFADSMGAGEKTPGGKDSVGVVDGAKADEPFSLGEIDFGDELTAVAVQQVNPEELKPAQELLFAPLAETQKKRDDAGEGPAAQPQFSVPQEDLPPLSIVSRRKQSPLFVGLIAVLAVLVVAVLGYVGYSTFGVEKVAKESGRITIRGVNAVFVKNKVAGELLVISGEAVNNFAGPRAAIQVKGMIYGQNGQVLASKNAFCGNPLTSEQLASMSLDKMEAAMANQFGDSLDNLEVPPGRAIPFVIVIAGPPKDAKDYGVEPAGSTVATDKQQQH